MLGEKRTKIPNRENMIVVTIAVRVPRYSERAAISGKATRRTSGVASINPRIIPTSAPSQSRKSRMAATVARAATRVSPGPVRIDRDDKPTRKTIMLSTNAVAFRLK